MYKRICVAVDGSATADHALTEALRLSEGSAPVIRLLYVVDVRVNAAEGVNLEASLDSWRREGARVIEEAAKRVRAAGLEAETLVTESEGRHVGDRIVEEARRWGAEAIVIGTHGRRGVAHLLLGSVAERVLRSSPLPVITVRGPHG